MESNKHQLIFIRGGESFDTNEEFYKHLRQKKYDPYSEEFQVWREWLDVSLSEEFESFIPLMPNKQWADYEAWKIWFEKIFDYINLDSSRKLVLIGYSLGASFLLKYLSENKMPKNVDQLHLVAAACDDNESTGERISNFKPGLNKFNEIENQCDKIFMYHSKDDFIVPFEQSLTIKQNFSKVEFLEFDDRGHFFQPTFIELFENIKKELESKNR